MTNERPMTISRVCDRLWLELTAALKDATEFHPDGTLTMHESADADWITNGLMQAHKIETMEQAANSNQGV